MKGDYKQYVIGISKGSVLAWGGDFPVAPRHWGIMTAAASLAARVESSFPKSTAAILRSALGPAPGMEYGEQGMGIGGRG